MMHLCVGMALALLTAFGCKKAAPAETQPTPTTPTEPGVRPAPAVDAGTASTVTGCDALSRRECLVSDGCTLELAGQNVYRCRADKGPCEIGAKQGDKMACEAKTACTFDSGTCYCPCEGAARTLTVEEPQSGCACACGGGEPATCREKAKIVEDCAKLTRKLCLESTRCTLHLVGKGTYECRADQGVCEVNIVQTSQKACEAQAGCAWKAGVGYCPCPGSGRAAVEDDTSGPVGCACGGTGGPPPMCAAK